MLLQNKAYEQLSNNESMPEKYRRSVDQQLHEMKKVAKGKIVLMVLVRTSTSNLKVISLLSL
jgi:hypothetical protein